MSHRALALASTAACLLCASPLLAPADTMAAATGGTAAQRAWVRSAATRFVTAELAGDGANACAVLVRRLRATVHGRTCAKRWDARLAAQLGRPRERAALRRELRAIPRARVAVRGDIARIDLPAPLLHGSSRFLWTENCWMLQG
jgi:hypothetical protein